ncbi:sigma-70 family RNA polymerase sigma factor [Amycolatopsis sp. EV170708-02-1]|uniref:sigma-70 family RNA polymerase sigma factor n=1 Tax=Amycolatopsis sp. EV170708-02-1 TaxID=2919322 RepID=UPI001F0C7C97|nr:sigma-70 family RNA polymerase sigma factor [Amycolatopsis sp. EV170708-02-1]UMP06942.1 sigma-70 family RNA polymerase sigma factor [Amycolatopsis sp. EV170708-02-1]
MTSSAIRHRRQVADDALVCSIVEEHGKAMLAYATRLLGDRVAAEDILQEAWVRAWRHPENLTTRRESLRGWLLTVVRNLVLDRKRARARRPTEVAESSEDIPVERDHADSVVDSIFVLAALDELTIKHRDALVQIYVHGTSVEEAAKKLGVPPGTVKSRSHYGLKVLRERLHAQGLTSDAA